MRFPAITLDGAAHAPGASHLPPDGSLLEKGRPARGEALKLWGLSLGMTLDLMTAMSGPVPLTMPDQDDVMGFQLGPGVVPPSLTSVFPRFSYPDVNFWIWWVVYLIMFGTKLTSVIIRVFGKRYREVVRGWEVSVVVGGTNDRRYVIPLHSCSFIMALTSFDISGLTGVAQH
jgi:hypothetical protein